MTNFFDIDDTKASAVRCTGAITRHLIDLFINHSPVRFQNPPELEKQIIKESGKLSASFVEFFSLDQSLAPEVKEEMMKETLLSLAVTHHVGKNMIEHYGEWVKRFRETREKVMADLNAFYNKELEKLAKSSLDDPVLSRIHKKFAIENLNAENKKQLAVVHIELASEDLNDFIRYYFASAVLPPAIEMMKNMQALGEIKINNVSAELGRVTMSGLISKQEDRVDEERESDQLKVAQHTTPRSMP